MDACVAGVDARGGPRFAAHHAHASARTHRHAHVHTTHTHTVSLSLFFSCTTTRTVRQPLEQEQARRYRAAQLVALQVEVGQQGEVLDVLRQGAPQPGGGRKFKGQIARWADCSGGRLLGEVKVGQQGEVLDALRQGAPQPGGGKKSKGQIARRAYRSGGRLLGEVKVGQQGEVLDALRQGAPQPGGRWEGRLLGGRIVRGAGCWQR